MMVESAAGGIFISYRRQETEHVAGRLTDRIAERFGESRVFMDIDSIPPGVDFTEAIQRAVGRCDALLVLIGRQWTTIRDEQGRRRLDDPDDFVVLEVRAALTRNIPVIPVLVDGADMPRRAELPAALEPLARRNAIRLDAVSFRLTVGQLLEHLERLLAGSADSATALESTSSTTAPHPPGATTLPESGTEEIGVGPPAADVPRPRHSLLWRAEMDRRTLLRLTGGVAAIAATGASIWGASRLGESPSGPRPWVFETQDEVYSSPTVDDGTVYIGSRDQNLYAIDAVTGRERWRYRAGAAITSSPAAADGVVYFGCNDFRVHAVDAATGTPRWMFPTGAVIHSSPTVANGVVYIGSRDHNLYAIDASTGQQRWRFPGKDWFNSSPTVVDGGVYVGCRDKNVYALEAATGQRRWVYTTGSTVDSSAAVSGWTMWIGSDDHNVYGLNVATGAQVWKPFTASQGVVSTPLVVRGVLFVGSDDGNLYALDATTGRERWRHRTGNGIRSSPALAAGLVYVGSRDRYLYAVNAATGERRWRFATEGPVDDSSPAVANGLVYVGSLDHRVYAVDAKTGTGP